MSDAPRAPGGQLQRPARAGAHCQSECMLLAAVTSAGPAVPGAPVSRSMHRFTSSPVIPRPAAAAAAGQGKPSRRAATSASADGAALTLLALMLGLLMALMLGFQANAVMPMNTAGHSAAPASYASIDLL